MRGLSGAFGCAQPCVFLSDPLARSGRPVGLLLTLVTLIGLTACQGGALRGMDRGLEPTETPLETSSPLPSTPPTLETPWPSPTLAPPTETPLPETASPLPDTATPWVETPTQEPPTPTPHLETPTQVPVTPTPEGEPPTPKVPTQDLDQDGYSVAAGDCDDANPGRHPGMAEVAYDGIDQDCSGADLTDVDGDRFNALAAGGEDCNDLDPEAFPDAEEVPYDGVDQDCDGLDVEDVDGDGFASFLLEGGEDCEDELEDVYPGALEVCDGIDQDCDGVMDEGLPEVIYADLDGDGYGDPATSQPGCRAEAGQAVVGGDCNDADASSYPDAAERCDGIDNDCDGKADDGSLITWYQDRDGDGFGTASVSTVSCEAPLGYVDNALDCNDARADAFPGAAEVCNGLDDDCDIQIDEGVKKSLYRDMDGDGFGQADSTPVEGCEAPAGYAYNNLDCKDTNDSVYPGALEVCNGVDDDCDGQVDNHAGTLYYQDLDEDGFGNEHVTAAFCAPPSCGWTLDDTDCNDQSADANPEALEHCDGLDNDCDGAIDEDGLLEWFEDLDGDGYGNPQKPVESCEALEGYVLDGTDCRDTNDAVNPGETEIANGIDDDCDGQADEGVYFASCKGIKQALPDSQTDGYTIDVDGASGPLVPEQVYCDMTTDGGGWTLVASNSRFAEILPRTGQGMLITTPGYNRNPDPTEDYLVGPLMLGLSFSEALVSAATGDRIISIKNPAPIYPYVSALAYSYTIVQDTFGGGVCQEKARYFVLGCKEKDAGNDADKNQNTTGACLTYASTGDPSEGTSFGQGVSEGSYEGYQPSSCVSQDVDYYTTWVR